MGIKQSFKNIEAIKVSDCCGCYHCLKIFDKDEIKEWVDESTTAICPHCGIDSVVTNTNRVELEKLHEIWF